MKITRTHLRRIIREEISRSQLLSEGVIESSLIDDIVALIPENWPPPKSRQNVKEALTTISTRFNLRTLASNTAVRNRMVTLLALAAPAAGTGLLGVVAGAVAIGSIVGGVFWALPLIISKSIENLQTIEGKLEAMERVLGRPVAVTDLGMGRKGGAAGELAGASARMMVGGKTLTALDILYGLAATLLPGSAEIEEGENLPQRLLNNEVIDQQFFGAIMRSYHKLNRKMTDELKEEIGQIVLQAAKKHPDDAASVLIDLSMILPV